MKSKRNIHSDWVNQELENAYTPIEKLRDTLRGEYPYIDESTDEEILELANRLLKVYIAHARYVRAFRPPILDS